MTEQTDIADILGTMANGPIIGAHRSKIEQLMTHFHRGGAHPGDLRRQAAPRTQRFHAEKIRLPAIAEISRLLPAPPEAQKGEEGEGRMSNFTASIEARLAQLAKMIPNAKTAERRALQRERADLESKLAKVSQ